jgi:hypothetical protein
MKLARGIAFAAPLAICAWIAIMMVLFFLFGCKASQEQPSPPGALQEALRDSQSGWEARKALGGRESRLAPLELPADDDDWGWMLFLFMAPRDPRIQEWLQNRPPDPLE